MSAKPELLLNHRWTIGVALGDDGNPASKPTQLRSGDQFEIERDQSGNTHLKLWMNSSGGAPVYNFEAEVLAYDHYTRGEIYHRATIKFIDDAGGGRKEKILEMRAGRLQKGYNNSPGACVTHLQGYPDDFADFLDTPQKRRKACGNQNLVIWQIRDVNQGPQDPPESGQGTASG